MHIQLKILQPDVVNNYFLVRGKDEKSEKFFNQMLPDVSVTGVGVYCILHYQQRTIWSAGNNVVKCISVSIFHFSGTGTHDKYDDGDVGFLRRCSGVLRRHHRRKPGS